MYIEDNIKSLSNKIIKKYGTSNPLTLIKGRKNITFNLISLSKNVNGLYTYISEKKQMILINKNLNGAELEFALFHEFAHYILGHRGEILLACTNTSSRKEEYEADLFATYMFLTNNLITKDNIDDSTLPYRARQLAEKFLWKLFCFYIFFLFIRTYVLENIVIFLFAYINSYLLDNIFFIVVQ